MAQRLVDRFQRGERVEITLDEETWLAGWVVQFDHPGLWVKTVDGRFWFVTNTRRIRPAPPEQADAS